MKHNRGFLERFGVRPGRAVSAIDLHGLARGHENLHLGSFLLLPIPGFAFSSEDVSIPFRFSHQIAT